jgi:Zn-dependent protease
MSERSDPRGFGGPGRLPPTEASARFELVSAPRDPWSAPPSGPPPYRGVYPPPPEYYLPQRQRNTDTVPPPPPEHAHGASYGASYPELAPDGDVHWAQAQTAVQPMGAQQPPPAAAAVGRRAAGGPGSALFPLGSALLSFALYAWYGGWQFGLGLVLLLLVHEMGHFVLIRAKGLPASLPIFIPFLGAYVAMRRMPQSVRDEAEIALAGPLAGALAGAACFLAYYEVGEPEGHTLLFLAYFSFLINLLNLIPVWPLDGGRVVGAISRWLWPIGLVLLAVAFYVTQNYLLLLLGWLWFSQTIARFRLSRKQPYYALRLPARLYIAALYFGLAVGLALAVYLTQGLLFSGGGGIFGQ